MHHIEDGLHRAQTVNLHLLQWEGLETYFKVSIHVSFSFHSAYRFPFENCSLRNMWIADDTLSVRRTLKIYRKCLNQRLPLNKCPALN